MEILVKNSCHGQLVNESLVLGGHTRDPHKYLESLLLETHYDTEWKGLTLSFPLQKHTQVIL